MAHLEAVTDTQLHNLLGYLNLLGGLNRKRTSSSIKHILLQQLWALLLGRPYAVLSWRRPANFYTLWIGTLRATLPVSLALCMVMLLASLGQLNSPTQILLLGSFGWGVFVSSICIHEIAHICILRLVGISTDVLQRGLRFGIIHKKASPIPEITSAIAGPFFGVLYCSVVYVGMLILQAHTLAYLCLVIAGFHLCSLLPWSGDGQSLHKILRQRSAQ